MKKGLITVEKDELNEPYTSHARHPRKLVIG